LSCKKQDWVRTGLGKKKMEPTKIEMIAIDCEMVLCEDGSEAVVRVAAVDRDLKVSLQLYFRCIPFRFLQNCADNKSGDS